MSLDCRPLNDNQKTDTVSVEIYSLDGVIQPLEQPGVVAASMMVNKYWLPNLVFSNDPTQSTIIFLNRFWLAVPVTALWNGLIGFSSYKAGQPRRFIPLSITVASVGAQPRK